MDFQASEPEIISFEFEVVEDTAGEIDIQMTTFENDMEVEVEIVELDMEETDASEPSVEVEEKEQEVVQTKDTKETIAAKILEKVAEQGDQIVLSNVKLAVMAQPS